MAIEEHPVRPPRESGGKIAIVCVSRHGTALATRLGRLIDDSEVFAPAKFAADLPPEAHSYDDGVASVVARVFREYRPLIAIMSVGTAVRLVAPLIGDKHSDPAVVAVDDGGHFAISALSGHWGGANDLAKRVAELIGAQPVITTASDLANTLQVDLLGRHLGWEIESWAGVTPASAAVVNDEPVSIYQDVGETDWWSKDRSLPNNIRLYDTLQGLMTSKPRAVLLITDRLVDGLELAAGVPIVTYRPKTLVLGIGCNRGVGSQEIERAVLAVLEKNRLSPKSVRNIATIDLKADEPGLLQFAGRLGLSIQLYSAGQLNEVTGLPNPSEIALASVGARGVCEPAALLSSGACQLLVPKQKIGGVTVAVARHS